MTPRKSKTPYAASGPLPATMTTEEFRLDVSERDWQATVYQMCTVARCQVQYHTHDSRRSDAGWPDLAIVTADSRFLVAELKRQKGKLRPEQVATLTALTQAGVACYVWRPLDVDEIIRILEGWKPTPVGGWPTLWRPTDG